VIRKAPLPGSPGERQRSNGATKTSFIRVVPAGEQFAVQQEEGFVFVQALSRGVFAGAEGSECLRDLEVDFLQLDFFGRLRCGSQVGGFRPSHYRVPGCRLIGAGGGCAPAENRAQDRKRKSGERRAVSARSRS